MGNRVLDGTSRPDTTNRPLALPRHRSLTTIIKVSSLISQRAERRPARHRPCSSDVLVRWSGGERSATRASPCRPGGPAWVSSSTMRKFGSDASLSLVSGSPTAHGERSLWSEPAKGERPSPGASFSTVNRAERSVQPHGQPEPGRFRSFYRGISVLLDTLSEAGPPRNWIVVAT
jgi:hypothetical protein